MSERQARIAVVFPGQGSQKVGMAKGWVDHEAYGLWAQADAILGRDVTALGISADEATLRQADNCQIALFVHHAVLTEAFKAYDLPIALTAGHSLGEYNALLAAGVLGFEDALRLVDIRARSTYAAAQERPGTMVACLGGDRATIEAAAKASGAYVANENAPGQVTVSGSAQALSALKEALADSGTKVVDLSVGAAYHSPHVESAVPVLGDALDLAAFGDAKCKVVANVDAKVHQHAHDWPSLLRSQLVNPVLWKDSVETMVEEGVTHVVELGASAPLSGMIKRIARGLHRLTVANPEDLEPVVATLRSADE